MYYEKRYLQFNDLVFDGYDMISDYDEPIQYKGSSTAYSYTHGSYRAFKSDCLYVSERQVSMTITLKLKKIPCEYRRFYALFAEQELAKPGRLWAIKNGEILWAFAAVTNRHPVNSGKSDEIVWDVEFTIPGGVWHKANKMRTFVLPYDVCSLMDCKGFKDYDPCPSIDLGCCESCIEETLRKNQKERCDCCCEHDFTIDQMLCYHINELQAFYGCDVPFQLVYDCEAAERLLGDKAWGEKLCVKDICESSVVSGRFYSETDIPTEDVTIIITGNMQNPWITINGNTNIIEGEFSGKLIITPSGDVYYQQNECCDPELLDPNAWVIPSGMDYGWTIYPQMNSITVYLNECCSTNGLACVYVDATAITT